MCNDAVKGISAYHHTALCVSDWARSMDFYQRLGFNLLIDFLWPEGTSLHKTILIHEADPTLSVELFEAGDVSYPLPEQHMNTKGAFWHICFQTHTEEDVDIAYSYAISIGATSRMEPTSMRHVLTDGGYLDVRAAFVFGPDGEILEFINQKEAE